MFRKLNLSIPTPCHESWKNMTLSEQGRFCQSCKKEVVDFTTMNDTELLAFFTQKKSGSVCGRLVGRQLKTALPTERRTSQLPKFLLQFTLPSLLIAGEATSQVAIKQEVRIVADRTDSLLQQKSIDSKKKMIKGRITDESGTPIPFATISVEGMNIKTATDENGAFQLFLPIATSKTVMQIESVGYRSLRKKIRLKKNHSKETQVEVNLQMEDQLMGEVVIVGMIAKNYE